MKDNFYRDFANYIFKNHNEIYNEAVTNIKQTKFKEKKPVVKKSFVQDLLEKDSREREAKAFLSSGEADEVFRKLTDFLNEED